MTLQNGIPICLKVQTKVQQNDEMEEYSFEVSGQVVRKGSVIYLRYQEPVLVELAKETIVLVKIEIDGAIHITRTGENRTKLIFAHQEYKDLQYHTPLGTLPITTYASSLDVNLREEPLSGEIAIEYDLLSGNEKLGDYYLKMEFTT